MDENLYRYCDLLNKFAICDHFINGNEEVIENDHYITINCENEEDVGIWGKNFLGENFRKLYNEVKNEYTDQLLEKYIKFSEILKDRELINQQNIEYDKIKEKDLINEREYVNEQIPDEGGIIRCKIIIFNGNYNLEYDTGCDTTIDIVNSFLSKKYNLFIPNPKNRKYIGGLGTVIFLSMNSEKFKYKINN